MKFYKLIYLLLFFTLFSCSNDDDYDLNLVINQRVSLSGTINFRDMGNIPTRDGYYIQKNKLYRSESLDKLTDIGVKNIEKLKIVSIVDFRNSDEISNAPDKVITSVKNVFNLKLSVGPIGDLPGLDYLYQLPESDLISYMEVMNETFVNDSMNIANLRAFFDVLENEENLPLVFHCTLGKDRTGYATALFYYALGVDEKLIMDNFLISNKFVKDHIAPTLVEHPNAWPFLTVQPEYLEVAINLIESEYGSVDNYLVNVLDIDIKKLREIYLY